MILGFYFHLYLHILHRPMQAAGGGHSVFLILCVPHARFFLRCSCSRSAIMAMNSELVGLPLAEFTVYPKYFCRVSRSPRSHATSMAWRMARSTRLGVVEKRRATSGYSTLVTALMTSISSTASKMASRRY